LTGSLLKLIVSGVMAGYYFVNVYRYFIQ
jgi:hypothetical protein